jgi:hypothetical protein
MQKEMKEEVERLRTQYMFKVGIFYFHLFSIQSIFCHFQQQELESAIRKPIVPASVRAKKTVREFPSTPLAVPSSMSNWNLRGSQNVALKGTFEDTPMRPHRLAPDSKVSPSKIRRSPEKTRKSALLPGFENSFETSTPLRTQSARKSNKGKGRIDDDSAVFGPGFSQSMSVPSQFQMHCAMDQATDHDQAHPIPSSLPEHSQMNHGGNDPVGLVEGEEDLLVDEFDTLEPINWKAQVCHVLNFLPFPITRLFH